MVPESPTSIRIYAGALAVILGLQSAWLLGAEIAHPALPFFPVTGAEAKAATIDRSTAGIAAWLGWPRGALWVDYAITANAARLGSLPNGNMEVPNRPDESAFSIAETAAALAPSDARAWLLLASANLQFVLNSNALAQLKMSYYTSPYNQYLFPLRIQTIARSPAPIDDELRSLVEYEMRVVIRYKPELMTSIAPALRVASPTGRQFLLTLLGKLDPDFVSELNTANP
jgi:hypothetical protein